MKEISWGILGTAEIAEEQVIPAIQKSVNGKVAAIASRNPARKATKLAEQFDIPTIYSSYEELLADETIDAVYVPLPNELHAEWTKKAAAYGKNVLCEKPAGLTALQVEEMVAACKSANITFMESMMYQFHPQHKRVKEIIAEGAIGEVKQMRASFSFPLEKPGNFRLKSQVDGGGSIFDIGCYTIHAIRSFLGEPTDVLFVEETLTADGNTDIAAIGIFEHKNGKKSYFDCGMNMSTRNEYEIVGTKGTIRVPKAFIPQADGEGIIELIPNEGPVKQEQIISDYYVEGVEFFTRQIIDGKDLTHLAEDTLNNLKAMDSVRNWKKQTETIRRCTEKL
ncbi:Gfo/Idh/MocA family protein [Oceanobacillus alkalisoli]|uniref:Gfo/Idh/MocA family protein n=1 Tax=Oceanobacillus alkalisoli TaxID=2925113 RepID=UPI001F120558|nr:Gfo/Idh/MocA family oxidoreductase [Oceanobacillus alkalisoli]MCF3943309.1 Gfo/Idh/MocA family oxidoreductase [Oceanobacillus alkalisoli]